MIGSGKWCKMHNATQVMRIGVSASIAMVVVAACGVPLDDSVRGLDGVPAQLLATSTSTTTTTTTSSTTTTTIIVASTEPLPTIVSTTTIAEATTELIPLYFVNGDRFVEERRSLPLNTDLLSLIPELAIGPRDETLQFSAVTVVSRLDVSAITVEQGVAIVDLSSRFNDLSAAEQRRFVGQLVLTIASQRGIGQVRFRVNGNLLEVPQGDGTFGKELLSFDSFAKLVDTIPDPTLNTTTSEVAPPRRGPDDTPTTIR
jgi:spore germination protein GerM